jgi:amino acid transporter
MAALIYVCGFLGITACSFTCLMGFIRLVHAFACEGLIPKAFAEVNPATGIPQKASIILTLILVPVAYSQTLE